MTAALLAVMVGGSGGVAVAGGPPSTLPAILAEQAQIDSVVRPILAALNGTTGFAGLIASPQQNKLDLFWQGAVPDKITAIINQAPSSVIVETHPAAHSAAELQALADRVADLRPTGLNEVTTKSDGSGLEIGVSPDAPQSTIDTLNRVITVPFDLTRREIALQTGGKQQDSPPFLGAAAIGFRGGDVPTNTPVFLGCTSGFAVQLPDNSQRMLTAAHCGGAIEQGVFVSGAFGATTEIAGQALMGPAERPYQPSSAEGRVLDVTLIDTRRTGGVQGSIYTGNFNSADRPFPVLGVFPNIKGYTVCRSSGASNQTCGTVIREPRSEIMVPGDERKRLVVKAEAAPGVNASGPSDSGSPVFTPVAGGVLANGTTVAGDPAFPVTCTGRPRITTEPCARVTYYTDIAETLRAYGGATIVTTPPLPGLTIPPLPDLPIGGTPFSGGGGAGGGGGGGGADGGTSGGGSPAAPEVPGPVFTIGPAPTPGG